MNETTNYIPGMCNINPVEVRRRRMSGYAGILGAIVTFLVLLSTGAQWPYYIILFALLFIGRLGILQANSKFCAAYAATGKQHADDSNIETITDKASRKADQKKAQKLYIQALAVALPITVIAYLVTLI